jgi:hypothetical protein
VSSDAPPGRLHVSRAIGRERRDAARQRAAAGAVGRARPTAAGGPLIGAAAGPLGAATVLRLQRSAGNAAVGRMVGIQRKQAPPSPESIGAALGTIRTVSTSKT